MTKEEVELAGEILHLAKEAYEKSYNKSRAIAHIVIPSAEIQEIMTYLTNRYLQLRRMHTLEDSVLRYNELRNDLIIK